MHFDKRQMTPEVIKITNRGKELLMTTLITGIDSLTVKLAMLTLFIVLAKFITKRMGFKKLDAQLMKIHKPSTYILLITGTIHMFTSFIYIDRLGILPYILGLVCLLSIIGAAASFIKRKTIGEKWLFWHRIFSITALVTLFIHPIIVSTH